tara:strand:- start:5647 stop:7434 length:1788 start_codon:yes stop_codon:yes gene_type:complete
MKGGIIGSGLMSSSTANAVRFNKLAISDLYDKIKINNISRAIFSSDGRTVKVLDNSDDVYDIVIFPNDVDKLESMFSKNKIPFQILYPEESPLQGISTFLNIVFPILLIVGLVQVLSGRMSPPGGLNNIINPTKIEIQPITNTSFNDVAGCDDSKMELEEIVDFLKDPTKYSRLGAESPRGVLLEGPPGTGKTLLARAIAGEAGVPFISTSGSEFVEIFVGVGASRIRNIFEEAKKNAPCIIFIDEIDAIGKSRSGNNGFNSNDEREQTLNQILTEMDGFKGNTGVVVLAATNRGNVLDDALLRPGRFDRRIPVQLPSISGRLDILKVHSRNKVLEKSLDLKEIAARTIGFSGASLQNLMNEAAIVAARRNGDYITYEDIDFALDRITVGIQKQLPRFKEQNKLVAYHEAGHTLMAALSLDYDNVTKVTIIPRSNGAGGFTLFTPSEERIETGLYSFRYLKSQLSVALGGRVAEEIIYGKAGITTGASGDLQRVRSLARQMITQWGFTVDLESNDVPIAWESIENSNSFKSDISSDTEKYVDNEIKKLVTSAYEECKITLINNKHILDNIANSLLEKETLSGSDIYDIISSSSTE